VELAVAQNDESHWQTASTLLTLAQRLRLHGAYDRAQELLYLGVAENGVTVTPTVRDLGLALGLAPRVLTEAPPAAQTA